MKQLCIARPEIPAVSVQREHRAPFCHARVIDNGCDIWRAGYRMEIFAHSVEGKSEQYWELLAHHLSATGKRAARLADPFGGSVPALAMGLLHDIGKCAPAYQAYIRRPRDAAGSNGPDHSSAGAKERAAREAGCGFMSRWLNIHQAFGSAGPVHGCEGRPIAESGAVPFVKGDEP